MSEENATLLPGCPPELGDYFKFLMYSNLSKVRAAKQLMVRLAKMACVKLGVYKEDFGAWDPYKSSDFDLSLYQ